MQEGKKNLFTQISTASVSRAVKFLNFAMAAVGCRRWASQQGTCKTQVPGLDRDGVQGDDLGFPGPRSNLQNTQLTQGTERYAAGVLAGSRSLPPLGGATSPEA